MTAGGVPGPVAEVALLMATFGRPWALCGGWAVDAWLERQTREHHDVDVAVFADDQRAIFEHLRLRDFSLIAHDSNVDQETTEPWDGRRLDLPAHVHARREGMDLEVLLNQRAGGDWVLSASGELELPLSQCVRPSGWGGPTVVPEVLLFYKATAYFESEGLEKRPQDEADFRALLPAMDANGRAWLSSAVARVAPGHPWLTRLNETPPGR